MRSQLFLIILTISFVSSCASRYSRFGMMTHQRSDATEGSFLVAPIEKEVGLISTNGKVLKTWTFDQRVYNASLLHNGDLGAITISIMGDKFVRPFGHFEIRNDKNELVWQFTHPDLHHDFEELDNGDFLFITYAGDSVDFRGKKGKCDRLIRVNRNKETTWEMDIAPLVPWKEMTNELDENVKTKDGQIAFCHVNSVRYKDNKILISLRNLSRVMVIDYETKKLLWISPKDAFHRQHDAQWLSDGRIMVFNNQEPYTMIQLDKMKPSNVMTIDPTTNRTEVLAYGKGFPFHWSSAFMGGAQMLSNGNIWVSVSMNGQMIEVDRDNHIVQRFVIHPSDIEESNVVFFRSRFYEPNPVKKSSPKVSGNFCASDYVSWQSCRTTLGTGTEGEMKDVSIALPPKTCSGWEGGATFRCNKGKWELIKAERCEWTCPCCY